MKCKTWLHSCPVVNIFILRLWRGGTSHSRSVPLCDQAAVTVRSLHNATMKLTNLLCRLCIIPKSWGSFTAFLHVCSFIFVRMDNCISLHVPGPQSTSSPITELPDLSVNLDISKFESSGLPVLCADDCTATSRGHPQTFPVYQWPFERHSWSEWRPSDLCCDLNQLNDKRYSELETFYRKHCSTIVNIRIHISIIL